MKYYACSFFEKDAQTDILARRAPNSETLVATHLFKKNTLLLWPTLVFVDPFFSLEQTIDLSLFLHRKESHIDLY